MCRHFAPFGRQIGICASRWMWFLPECLLDGSTGGRVNRRTPILIVNKWNQKQIGSRNQRDKAEQDRIRTTSITGSLRAFISGGRRKLHHLMMRLSEEVRIISVDCRVIPLKYSKSLNASARRLRAGAREDEASELDSKSVRSDADGEQGRLVLLQEILLFRGLINCVLGDKQTECTPISCTGLRDRCKNV